MKEINVKILKDTIKDWEEDIKLCCEVFSEFEDGIADESDVANAMKRIREAKIQISILEWVLRMEDEME